MEKNGFPPGTLGKIGVTAGRLGIAGGLGAPPEAVEMAFERGCNYFYHGSRRRKGMAQAIKNLCKKGKRDELIIVAQIYTRWGWHFRRSFYSFLKKSGLDYADVLLLGWYNREPAEKIRNICAELKEKKLIRYMAVSGHERKLFPKLAVIPEYDIFHIRYNAVHVGAETEVFPHLPKENRPGIVIYTATSWKQLFNPKKTPPAVKTPSPSDCYRFVMSNPNVDVCMSGPSNMEQMKEALTALERGPMSDEEMDWMRKVGAHLAGGGN